jgi:hypothetical protein
MCGPGKTCHYRVLGLTISTKDSEIKTAYRKAIFRVHPDKLVGVSEATKAEGEAKSKLRMRRGNILAIRFRGRSSTSDALRYR